jgi:hypothetical protein
MAAVFTENSTVLCDMAVTMPTPRHGGTVITTGSSKLTVSNNRVLTATSLGGIDPMKKCTTVPPPMGSTACTSVVSVAPSCVALKLKAGGTGVLIETIAGVTNGVPPGKLSGSAGQTKLTAV